MPNASSNGDLPKGSFLRLPSTVRGRYRLAGLVLYAITSVVWPGVPAAIKAAASLVLGNL